MREGGRERERERERGGGRGERGRILDRMEMQLSTHVSFSHGEVYLLESSFASSENK